MQDDQTLIEQYVHCGDPCRKIFPGSERDVE